MTVCLTGDVHHMSMGARDQEYLNRTEVSLATKYARIAGSLDIPVTLFVTGRAAAEEPEQFSRLAKMNHVEVGGHNYFAYRAPFFGRVPYSITRKLFGIDAPAAVQRWEVRRTRRILAEVTEYKIRSWRNHGYRHDKNTVPILKNEGIKFYSDEVTPKKLYPYQKQGISWVPINVMPDHEHLIHGYRTEEYVRNQDWSNEFTKDSYQPQQWREKIETSVSRIESENGTATILAHPACMAIADDFSTFEELCTYLESRECKKMRELNNG